MYCCKDRNTTTKEDCYSPTVTSMSVLLLLSDTKEGKWFLHETADCIIWRLS